MRSVWLQKKVLPAVDIIVGDLRRPMKFHIKASKHFLSLVSLNLNKWMTDDKLQTNNCEIRAWYLRKLATAAKRLLPGLQGGHDKST